MDANTMGHVLVLRLKTSNYNLINFDDRERSTVLNLAQDEFVKRRTTADLNAKQKGFDIDSKRSLDLSSLVSQTTTFLKEKSPSDGDFMQGNRDNGGLRTPDIDMQWSSGGNYPYVATAYGVICEYPDEALYILSETCDTSKGNEYKFDVPVEKVSMEEYNANLRSVFKNPYYNKVWRVEDGNFTSASSSNSLISVKGRTGTNADVIGNPITFNSKRILHLIPGKDYVVEAYKMHYIKRPQRIVVDTITPGNQASCELHDGIHDEIIDIAVGIASQNAIPEIQRYQVADKEKREDE